MPEDSGFGLFSAKGLGFTSDCTTLGLTQVLGFRDLGLRAKDCFLQALGLGLLV